MYVYFVSVCCVRSKYRVVLRDLYATQSHHPTLLPGMIVSIEHRCYNERHEKKIKNSPRAIAYNAVERKNKITFINVCYSYGVLSLFSAFPHWKWDTFPSAPQMLSQVYGFACSVRDGNGSSFVIHDECDPSHS